MFQRIIVKPVYESKLGITKIESKDNIFTADRLQSGEFYEKIDQIEKDCELMVHSLRKGYKQGQITFAKRMLEDVKAMAKQLMEGCEKNK